jgi:hypothetical protein
MGSERSVEQTCEPMYKSRIRGLVVNPAVARGKRSNLPREICRLSGTEGRVNDSDRAAEVSRTHSSCASDEGRSPQGVDGNGE